MIGGYDPLPHRRRLEVQALALWGRDARVAVLAAIGLKPPFLAGFRWSTRSAANLRPRFRVLISVRHYLRKLLAIQKPVVDRHWMGRLVVGEVARPRRKMLAWVTNAL